MPPTAPPDMTAKLMRLKLDHLKGRRGGMVSVCSARGEVLEAALALAAETKSEILVEVTPNQVDAAGGYTGLTPEAFIARLFRTADEVGLPRADFAAGADHLGPYAFRRETSAQALAKAAELAGRFVSAGFRKVHLDTGFGCADDPPQGVSVAEAAGRAAHLCRAAEAAAEKLPAGAPRPLYVIGAEVPPPGGALEEEAVVEATPVENVAAVIRATESAFRSARLDSAWERVIAVVVQPGVDFGDAAVSVYRPENARALSALHAVLPGNMTFEVHSTDFQPAAALARMVRDHFSLLKVGPCLSFAFREAVFALAAIESEWLSGRRGRMLSQIRPTLERVMKQEPAHWNSHYRGLRSQRRLQRSYSYRDRIRYYWAHPEVEAALKRLMANLVDPIPPGLLHQFFPDLAEPSQDGARPPQPWMLVRRRIQSALRPYLNACRVRQGVS